MRLCDSNVDIFTLGEISGPRADISCLAGGSVHVILMFRKAFIVFRTACKGHLAFFGSGGPWNLVPPLRKTGNDIITVLHKIAEK